MCAGTPRPRKLKLASETITIAIEKVATVHDLHATMLNQLGIEPDRFTIKFQGLDAKLTGVEGGRVISEILS